VPVAHENATNKELAVGVKLPVVNVGPSVLDASSATASDTASAI
jgi:hypothetical protein